jgi:uncharacterized protein YndB with AHSA1/START domain
MGGIRMGTPVARTDLLIRVEPHEVFDAFVDPRRIEQFWLRHASGPLAAGAVVDWEFMAAGSRERVSVTEVAPPRRIRFSWSDGIDVDIRIDPFDADGSRVWVEASGFAGDGAADMAVAAAAGFTIVLCDLKSLLETGRSGNMVRDKAILLDADSRNADPAS